MELCPGHGFWGRVYCYLDFRNRTLGQGHDTPLGHGQQLCEILSRYKFAVGRNGPDTDFWGRVHCDLDIRDRTFGRGRQYVCEILSRFNIAEMSYGPDTDFQYILTLGQGHHTPFGHRQQLCELSRSKLGSEEL